MKKKVRERLERIEDALKDLIAEVAKLQPALRRPPDESSAKQQRLVSSRSKSVEKAPRNVSRKRSSARSQGLVDRDTSDDQ